MRANVIVFVAPSAGGEDPAAVVPHEGSLRGAAARYTGRGGMRICI